MITKANLLEFAKSLFGVETRKKVSIQVVTEAKDKNNNEEEDKDDEQDVNKTYKLKVLEGQDEEGKKYIRDVAKFISKLPTVPYSHYNYGGMYPNRRLYM